MTAAAPPERPLELRPFPGQPAPAALRLRAAAGWLAAQRGRGLMLGLRWRLEGDLARLALPEPAIAPERRDGLWEHTCFELFLGCPGDAAYLELNLSPAGHWNLYRLEGYRSGLRPDPALTVLASERRQGPGWLELAVELPATLLPGGPGQLQLAVTAVVQDAEGCCSFWALAHCGPEPDFHRRESFVHGL